MHALGKTVSACRPYPSKFQHKRLNELALNGGQSEDEHGFREPHHPLRGRCHAGPVPARRHRAHSARGAGACLPPARDQGRWQVVPATSPRTSRPWAGGRSSSGWLAMTTRDCVCGKTWPHSRASSMPSSPPRCAQPSARRASSPAASRWCAPTRKVRTRSTRRREAALRAAVDAHLGAAHAVVLSDYGKGVLSRTLIAHVVQAASSRGLPVFVDPKSDDFGRYGWSDLHHAECARVCGGGTVFSAERGGNRACRPPAAG